MAAVSAVAELDESRAFEGLSSSQWRLCQAIFSGANAVDAYREVYGEGAMNINTLRDRAWKAANDPLVKQKLITMRLKAEAESTLFRGLSREFVVNGLMGLATNGDKDSVKLGALVALGKTVGIDLFRDVSVVTKVTRTPEDVDRELREKIQELQRTVEGTASRLEPAGPARPDRRRKPKA